MSTSFLFNTGNLEIRVGNVEVSPHLVYGFESNSFNPEGSFGLREM